MGLSFTTMKSSLRRTWHDYDAALLMGPLYHLLLEADRVEAIRQVIRKLKDGGLLFSAFISRLGLMADLLKKRPDWIEHRDEVRAVLEMGQNSDNSREGNFRGYFARVPEIRPLHENLGIQTIRKMMLNRCHDGTTSFVGAVCNRTTCSYHSGS